MDSPIKSIFVRPFQTHNRARRAHTHNWSTIKSKWWCYMSQSSHQNPRTPASRITPQSVMTVLMARAEGLLIFIHRSVTFSIQTVIVSRVAI